MHVRATLWALVGLVGLILGGWGSYVVVRGPFLGGEPAEGTMVLVATGAFVVGVVLLALGGSKAVRHRLY